MKADGMLEVERRHVAKDAGVQQVQRVSDAYRRAVAVGHLIFVTKMAYGQPSRYQATFPDSVCNETCRGMMHLGQPLNTPVVNEKPFTIPDDNLRERNLGGSADLSHAGSERKKRFNAPVRRRRLGLDDAPGGASPERRVKTAATTNE